MSITIYPHNPELFCERTFCLSRDKQDSINIPAIVDYGSHQCEILGAEIPRLNNRVIVVHLSYPLCCLTIGYFIKTNRKARELSQKELAKHMAVQYPYLTKVENDRVECTDSLLNKTADFFQVDFVYLKHLRRQTIVRELNLENAMFPLHVKDVK